MPPAQTTDTNKDQHLDQMSDNMILIEKKHSFQHLLVGYVCMSSQTVSLNAKRQGRPVLSLHPSGDYCSGMCIHKLADTQNCLHRSNACSMPITIVLEASIHVLVWTHPCSTLLAQQHDADDMRSGNVHGAHLTLGDVEAQNTVLVPSLDL